MDFIILGVSVIILGIAIAIQVFWIYSISKDLGEVMNDLDGPEPPVGDGVADDTAAIQALVTPAPPAAPETDKHIFVQ